MSDQQLENVIKVWNIAAHADDIAIDLVYQPVD